MLREAYVCVLLHTVMGTNPAARHWLLVCMRQARLTGKLPVLPAVPMVFHPPALLIAV